MKLIDSIIKKLKRGVAIQPPHRKIIGLMLEEMMRRERIGANLYKVEMSLDMYKRINNIIYNANGEIKNEIKN